MTTYTKIIVGSIAATGLVLIGAIFLLSKNTAKPQTSQENIVATNGLHWHPRLEIDINGKKQVLANGIGLGTLHQEMHTHEEDYKEGIVHMEMQGLVTNDETKLGTFFEIWKKTFNSSQIFEYKNSSEAGVKMFVNGKEIIEFENYHMRDKDSIVIKYE
ncbi:MAG: hypothetical protein HYV38_02880 [Candidatus Levybacteria bacterium]|nr:hypothetical protein [Candidatus Levybacteria bacterium]